MINNTIIVRSGGDLGTGIAHKLFRCGFKVLILESQNPLAIRRTVSFSEAIFKGEIKVEDVKAIKVYNNEDIWNAWDNNLIPIMVDEKCNVLKLLQVEVVVDAIMAKNNLGTNKNMAPITIAIGPGFEAGKDVDIVIETNRGHDLGRLILKGSAQVDTGIPGNIMGFDKERVIKASTEGIINNLYDIGEFVRKGENIAYIENIPVKATLDGVLRGMIRQGTFVTCGLKIADIDPRGNMDYCNTISDKARTIAGGVLEAILYCKVNQYVDKSINKVLNI